MAEAEKEAPPSEQRRTSSEPSWPPARWTSLRPKLRRVSFVDGGDHDYAAALEPEEATLGMADVVRQARMLSVQQVRMLTEQTDSVEELLFEKSLREEGLSRDDFDSKSTASSRGKSNSNLLALQVWSAEHHFSDADRMTLAAHFVQQALDRNDVCHVRWDSPWAQRAYYLHTRRSWRLLVLLGAAAMYLLVLFEPKGSTWQVAPDWGPLVGEGVLLSLLLLNLSLPCYYSGARDYLSRRIHQLEFGLIMLLLTDYIIAIEAATRGAPSLRFGRPLRGFLVLFIDRAVQHCIHAVLLTVPALRDLMLMLLLVFVVFSLFAVSFFGDLEDPVSIALDAANASVGAADPRAALYFGDGFHSFTNAFLSLFSLWSTDNYPRVIAPTLRALDMNSAGGGLAIFFFLSFILGSVFMITSVLVAVVFETYRSFHGKAIMLEKSAERRALLAAFAMIDANDTGHITLRQFHSLVRTLRSGARTNEIRAVFEMLDKDKSSAVGADEFLALCDLLILRFTVHKSEGGYAALRVSSPRMRAIMEHPCFDYLTYAFILTNLVLVIVSASEQYMTEGEKPYGTLFWPELACVAWFLMEMVIKLCGLGILPYVTDGWHIMDGLLTVSSLAGVVLQVATWEAAAATSSDSVSAEGSGSLRALRVLRVMRMARTISILSHTRSLRAISETFLQVLPMFYALLAVLLLLSNVWASIGVELFGPYVPTDPTADCYPVCGTFASWPDAMLSMSQVWLGNGWVALMYKTMNAMRAAGWSSPAAWWIPSLFFTSFFFAVNVVLTNLLGALVIEIYIVETEKSKRLRENELAMGKLFDMKTSQAAELAARNSTKKLANAPAAATGKMTVTSRRASKSFHSKRAGTGLDTGGARRGLARGLSGLGEKVHLKPGLEHACSRAAGLCKDLNNALHQGNGGGTKASRQGSNASLASAASAAFGPPTPSKAADANRASTERRGYDKDNFEKPMQVAEILTDSVQAKFSKYDRNHAGVISTADCALLLRELGETSIDEEGMSKITLELDADNSGRIDFREFLDWWQHHGMQRVFMRFDRDQSGSIDTGELVELLKSLGLQLSDSQLEAAKTLLDPDGDGCITWAEYIKWWERFDVQRIFEQYDTDGGGDINGHELQLLCADLGVHLSKKEVREALKKLDKDGSSSLSFDEFFPWWCAISDMKSDSSLVVETKGGRWEDNLFLQVDKVNQLKDRQRVHLIEVAHVLGLSVPITEQLAKKLELEVEHGTEHAAGKALNHMEVKDAQELRSAFAGCKKGGGSRGVEAALMKSRGAAEGGRNSAAGTAASSHETARSARAIGSERFSGARGSIMSGCSAVRNAISSRASCSSKGGERKSSKRGTQIAPEEGGTDVGGEAPDAVKPLSLGEAGPSLSAG